MEHSWIDTLIQWGAYAFSSLAIFMTQLVHSKFKAQDDAVIKATGRIDTVEKQLIEHQLDASRRYVDKQEYLNTMNRVYDKLDSIDRSVNVLNSTMGGTK